MNKKLTKLLGLGFALVSVNSPNLFARDISSEVSAVTEQVVQGIFSAGNRQAFADEVAQRGQDLSVSPTTPREALDAVTMVAKLFSDSAVCERAFVVRSVVYPGQTTQLNWAAEYAAGGARSALAVQAQAAVSRILRNAQIKNCIIATPNKCCNTTGASETCKDATGGQCDVNSYGMCEGGSTICSASK